MRCTRRNAKLVIIATSALTTTRIIPAAGNSPGSEPPLSKPQTVKSRSSFLAALGFVGGQEKAQRDGRALSTPKGGSTRNALREVALSGHRQAARAGFERSSSRGLEGHLAPLLRLQPRHLRRPRQDLRRLHRQQHLLLFRRSVAASGKPQLQGTLRLQR